jgi:Ca2+/Na+ antiporter
MITSFWAGVSILVLSTFIVFLLLRKPVWAELEFTVLVISAITFLFYFYILYHGVRFDRNEKYSISGRSVEFPTWLDTFDVGWLDLGIDFGEGFLGVIVSLIVGLLIALLAVVLIGLLIWVGANLITVGLPVLFLPLYMVFRRAVRYVAAKGRRCFGKAVPSALFAFRATLVNMGWVYIVIYLGHRLSLHLHKIGRLSAG